jgi:NADH dehydrogenase
MIAAPTTIEGTAQRHRVVVIGSGFGGLTATKALKNAPVDVTMIARTQHHLFQPLLYQVATAGLSPAEIAAPIRSIVDRIPQVTVILGKVSETDTAQRLVQYRHKRPSLVIRPIGGRHWGTALLLRA